MKGVRFNLFLALLGSGACGAPVEGALLIKDDQGRMIEFSPERCADGEHYGYFGVELRDDDDRVLEFFRDGDAPGVTFYAPGQAAFELRVDDCEQLAGELHRDSPVSSEDGEVRGHLEIDCEVTDGWSLQGSLSFRECHGPPSEEECEA